MLRIIDRIIKFPLLKNDRKPIIPLSKEQEQAIQEFLNKVERGEYKLVDYPCICGNSEDILIAEKDRYGIPLNIYLCKNCGTIRSGKVLDRESLIKFYSDDYSKIYVSTSPDVRFKSQFIRGKDFVRLCKDCGILDKIENVFEIGCGAGGILAAFKEIGLKVSGCDLDREHLEYGISRGLNLLYGDYRKVLHSLGSKQDCIILSHVLEHFLDPINELEEIAKKIKVNGYILIQVPSLYSHQFNPILTFQNAHTIQFFDPEFLSFTLENLGFRVVCLELTPQLTIIGQKRIRKNKHISFNKNKEEIMKIQYRLKRAYISTVPVQVYTKLQKYPTLRKILSKVFHKIKN